MANIEKLQFLALELIGANYTAWITNMEIHLDSEKILDTIKEGNKSASHEKAKAVIFMRKLCKLYQETIKGKAKEVNLNEHFEGTTSTYLESSDFMGDFDETTHQDN